MNKKFDNIGRFKKIFVYKTERSDDLLSIAEKFGTTERIIVADNLLTEEPRPGEMLVVEKPEGRAYVVKPFDTLESISGGDKKRELEILKNNKTDFIYVGQKLYI